MNKTRRVTTYIQRFKGKILNLFSQSWLTRNIHAEEIHARILIVFYAALLALGVFLFITFNYVPTRECDFWIEELGSGYNYQIKRVVGTYYCEQTCADITINVPMTLQPDPNYIGTIDVELTPQRFLYLSKDTNPIYIYKALERNSNAEEVLENVDFLEDISIPKAKSNLSLKLFDKLAHYYNTERQIDSLKAECDMRIPSDSLHDCAYYVGVRQLTNERTLFTPPSLNHTDNPISYLRSVDSLVLKRSELTGNFKDLTDHVYLKSSSRLPLIIKSNITQDGGILSTPRWLILGDLSQSYYIFKLKTSTFDRASLYINFKGATNFSKMTPEPDEITMNAIGFTDAYKIEQIKKNGLVFHAEFNEMKNKQNVRNFAMTSLMALVIGAFIKELFVLLYHYMSERKRIKISPDGK